MSYIDDQVMARRKALQIEAEDKPVDAANKWGLALSGGGIRSATFCLGLLRALGDARALHRFDILSTVSGGGYVGGMMGRLFSRAEDGRQSLAIEAAFGKKEATWFIWWLRANGRYLIPQGMRDTVFVVALYIRNLVAIHFELGLLGLFLGLCLAGLNLLSWAGLTWLGYWLPDPVFPLLQSLPAWTLPVFPVVWFALPVVLAQGAVRAGAYWNVTRMAKGAPVLPNWATFVALALLLAGMVALLGTRTSVGVVGAGLRWIALAALAALLAIRLFALPTAARYLRAAGPVHDPQSADTARTELTKALARSFEIFCLIFLLGAIDRFAWFVAFELEPLFNLGQGETALWLALSAAVIRALLPLVAGLKPGGTPLGALLGIGRVLGYLMTFLLCVWWVSLAFKGVIGAAFSPTGLDYRAAAIAWVGLALPVGIYLALSLQNVQFLNLSSLHAFYKARLSRSYLGAANAARFDPGKGALGALEAVDPLLHDGVGRGDVNKVDLDDDIPMRSYRPQDVGGPVHILNVCVNQTRDPRGGLFNQDRRGLNMSIASGGQHKLSLAGWNAIEGTDLSLGTWIAISGAAVAPGLGPLTRGGIAALAMFAGVRLGYWWDKATRTGKKGTKWDAKARGILSETFGNFEGSDGDDWFLTDGGHFDNTAAYALLAERADVIVLADCGADPNFAFDDLENLVRKARIDLQAEILFQRPRHPAKPTPPAEATPTEVAESFSSMDPALEAALKKFGSLDELSSPTSSACLALAEISYFEKPDKPGILLVIKPNFCAGLPVDLVNFKKQNPEFPQQTTADQFFSEAQWESYFHLGTFLGKDLSPHVLELLAQHHGTYFEADELSPFERAGREKSKAETEAITKATVDSAEAASAVRPASRLPSRISSAAAATVGTTLSFGAIATAAVAAYQSIESARQTYDKRIADERGALKDMELLWTRVPKAVAAEDGKAVSDLAAAVVLTADTLCPNDEAQWFRSSRLAQTILLTAQTACRDLRYTGAAMPPACAELIKSEGAASGSRRSCLASAEDDRLLRPSPQYWFYDYSGNSILADAHPCDVSAITRENTKRSAEIGAGRSAEERFDVLAYPDPQCHFSGRFAAYVAALEQGKVDLGYGTLAGLGAASPAWPTNAALARFSGACEGVTVYSQIYGQDKRALVRQYGKRWTDFLKATIPPIEDVVATAQARGRTVPSPVSAPTIRNHDAASLACANALGPTVGHSDWHVEPLNPRLSATPRTVEVWIPPDAATR